MAIVAKNDIPPQVSDGQHPAVCCDVHDLGMVPTTYMGEDTGLKHKIKVWFQVGETGDDGKRKIVGQRFTLSMHENANLRKFLENWRGKKYTDAQAAQGVDVEKMLGHPALIQTTTNDRGYADITSIMKLPDGMAQLEVADFVRFKDREQTNETHAGPGFDEMPEGLQDDDDSLPF